MSTIIMFVGQMELDTCGMDINTFDQKDILNSHYVFR